ncbi:MAG TPA: hypothetical protein PLZ57_09425 [Pseudobdellovibrionaceae bacterium]|mgnify:CR=1 FL=1|nr:hypothetical protein [Pseudobdellovibrionaceae bacterium]
MQTLNIQRSFNSTFVSAQDFTKFGWIVISRQFARVSFSTPPNPSTQLPSFYGASLPIEAIDPLIATLSPIFIDIPLAEAASDSPLPKNWDIEAFETTLKKVARILHADNSNTRNPIALLEINDRTDCVQFQFIGELSADLTSRFGSFFESQGVPVKNVNLPFETMAGFALPSGRSGADLVISVPASMYFDRTYSNSLGYTNQYLSTIILGLVAMSWVISETISE